MADVVSVRRATVDDAPDIARVHARSWQAAYRGILPDDLLERLSHEDRLPRWRQFLEGADTASALVLVAVDAGRVDGFASLGPSRDDDLTGAGVMEVYGLYVDPDAWRRGLGGALMDAAADQAAGSATTLVLWVMTSNLAGRRFYERRGMSPDGSAGFHDVMGTSIPVVRYRMPLG